MSLMADHTVRGKLVRLRGVEANVRIDGTVHIGHEGFEPFVLSEQEALDLYQVLADVIEYGPGDGSGTTEGTTEREAARDG